MPKRHTQPLRENRVYESDDARQARNAAAFRRGPGRFTALHQVKEHASKLVASETQPHPVDHAVVKPVLLADIGEGESSHFPPPSDAQADI